MLNIGGLLSLGIAYDRWYHVVICVDLTVGFRKAQGCRSTVGPCWSTRQRPSYEAVDETQATLEDEPREAQQLQMYCWKRGGIFSHLCQGHILVESNEQQIYGISKGFFPYNSAVFGLVI